MRRMGAFTLIELLIVVAIIAILAAIAVPNFLEAKTRALGSLTLNDLRTIELALESYRVDNNQYVPSMREFAINFGTASTLVAGERRCITTPIAYVDSVPVDIFRKIAGLADPNYYIYAVGWRVSDGSAQYSTYPHASWMTWSAGPDQVSQPGGFRTLKAIEQGEATGTVSNGARYDPTNGTVSLGDIYRHGGDSRYRG